INVSGQKLIKMADLQRHFMTAGATAVQTYIQSGNVVFQHAGKSTASVRRQIETGLAKGLGYPVPTLVLTPTELAAMVQGNPYPSEAPEFGRRMYMGFLATDPTAAAVAAIQPMITPEEQLVVQGRVVYALYATGMGKAKLTSAVIERKLGLVTMRNWNTVTAVLALVHGK
ncbi:MAG TPA: DUF1697 domain-containing protein, partial [Verrucomicrobiae bacterium]